MMRRALLLPILSLLYLAGGCASVPQDGGLASVRDTVFERGGATFDGTPSSEQMVSDLLASELDADGAVALAFANNPRMRLLMADLDLARSELLEASTIPNPMLELEWRGSGGSYRLMEVTLAQSILELLTLPRRRGAGRFAFEAATQRVARDVLGFAAEVRDDYYALLASTQRLSFSRTATEAAQVAAELAIRQHMAGNITDLALERRQAAYERAKLMLSRDEEDVLVRREALIRDLGLRDGSIDWRIANEFPPLPESEPGAAELEASLAERRLDMIVASRELDALRRSLPASWLEEVGEVVIDYHREREPDGEKTAGPGIEFPIPIFNRGTAARTRAGALLARASGELELLSVTAASEVRIARQRLLAARARVEYYRDVIVPRQARIVDLTMLEHNSMLLGTYDLLQARQEETNVRREYADAQRDYWSARNDLDRALNGVAGGSGVLAPGGGGAARLSMGEGGH
jgi:outer membrane protein, heavy metal efflux system